jgi:Flp pilus assembly protein TadB
MIENLSARVIAIIVAAVVAVLVVWAAFHFWEKSRSQGAQARVDTAQSGAASNSAADAIGTVAASGARESASEDLTRQNEVNIRAANGSGDAVNPAVRDAGIQALCRRAAYRNDPRCKGAVK